MPFTMLLQVIVNVIYYVVTGECHLLCCYRLMPFTMLLQVNRLETQVKRFKYDAEEAEKLEEELKSDRRRLQREVHSYKLLY